MNTRAKHRDSLAASLIEIRRQSDLALNRLRSHWEHTPNAPIPDDVRQLVEWIQEDAQDIGHALAAIDQKEEQA